MSIGAFPLHSSISFSIIHLVNHFKVEKKDTKVPLSNKIILNAGTLEVYFCVTK